MHADSTAMDETASEERVSAAIKDEMRRIHLLIKSEVECKDIRMMFYPMATFREFSERIVDKFVTIISKMSIRERERAAVELSHLVFEETAAYREQMEMVVDQMIYASMERDLIPLSVCLEALVTTSDFTLRTKLVGSKYRIVKQHIHKLDYKGVRTVFKRIIDIQFGRLPQLLSTDQRRELIPIEELLLYIMDRRSNVFPALFSITEINRTTHKRMFMFPRLAASATYLENSFRPLAELAYVIGRCFLFPLPSHTAFTSSTPGFRIDSSSNHLLHRSIIPYREEFHSPQKYMLYMILRQPKGKDHLHSLFKLLHHSSKILLDDLIAVIISETMAAVEELPPDAEIPRYQWENIFHIFFHEVSNTQCNFPKLAKLLAATITKTGYRRARDELMWIVLQFCGFYWNHISAEYLDAVLQLYKAAYAEEETWTGASDHPQTMVRFLAPACLWILMDGKETLSPAKGSLANQIEFVKSGLERITEDATLAVLLNSCRTDLPLEQYSDILKAVTRQLTMKIESQPSDEPFLLSYGKVAGSKIIPLSIDFLDSLTIRSKKHLYDLCVNFVINYRDRLPSFAAIDTCARLLQMMEFDQGANKFIHNIFGKAVTMTASQPGPAQQSSMDSSRDRLHIFLEILSFRLAGMQTNVNARQTLIMTSISGIIKTEMQMFSPLYFALEHLIMRQWTWIPFSECLSLANNLWKPTSKVINNLLNVHSFANVSGTDATHLCLTPEVVKLFFITVFRAYKVTGSELPEDVVTRIVTAYPLPHSILASMPVLVEEKNAAVLPAALEELNNRLMILEAAVTDDYNNIRSGMTNEYIINYYQMPERQPTLLCVIFLWLLDDPLARVSPPFYSLLENLNARTFVVYTNALVDYILFQLPKRDGTYFQAVIPVLDKMVYQSQVIPIDRLILALALHPQTDEASNCSLFIIRSLIILQETRERINTYVMSVPACAHPATMDFCRKLAEYHKRFPELTYSESTARVTGAQGDPVNPRAHLPVYYGNCIERMLPTVDFILSRALELRMPDDALLDLLEIFGPLYKYHPAPITYLYTVLFSLYEHLGQSPRAKLFAHKIISGVDTPEPFTNSFVSFNHQKPNLEEILRSLVERVVTSSEFLLTPPAYVSQDWRFAELPPAGQALYMACCEIMASPHPPEHIITGFVNLLCSRPLPRPYVTLNVIALIVTALPTIYANRICEQVVTVLESTALEELSVAQIGFENFEESCLLKMDTRVTSVVALIQAYWQHSNLSGLTNMLNLFEANLRPHVKTEKELMFVLRIIVPLLQRSYDTKDRSRQIDDCLRMVNLIYRMVGDVSAQYELQYEDTICDLLYHFKYMYVGDFVKAEAEEAMLRMRPSLQAKLKFINPRDTTAENEKEESDRERDIARLTGKISVDLTSIQPASDSSAPLPSI